MEDRGLGLPATFSTTSFSMTIAHLAPVRAVVWRVASAARVKATPVPRICLPKTTPGPAAVDIDCLVARVRATPVPCIWIFPGIKPGPAAVLIDQGGKDWSSPSFG
jgi:hypothetical protein